MRNLEHHTALLEHMTPMQQAPSRTMVHSSCFQRAVCPFVFNIFAISVDKKSTKKKKYYLQMKCSQVMQEQWSCECKRINSIKNSAVARQNCTSVFAVEVSFDSRHCQIANESSKRTQCSKNQCFDARQRCVRWRKASAKEHRNRNSTNEANKRFVWRHNWSNFVRKFLAKRLSTDVLCDVVQLRCGQDKKQQRQISSISIHVSRQFNQICSMRKQIDNLFSMLSQ